MRKKKYTEADSHPDEDFYKDLIQQDQIMDEVRSSYRDCYKGRETNPDYVEIVDALSPNAIMMLTEMEIRQTEKQIILEDLTKALVKTRNNTAPGSKGIY